MQYDRGGCSDDEPNRRQECAGPSEANHIAPAAGLIDAAGREGVGQGEAGLTENEYQPRAPPFVRGQFHFSGASIRERNPEDDLRVSVPLIRTGRISIARSCVRRYKKIL